MQSVSDATFTDSVLRADRPVLLLFKKPGCHACTVAKRHLLEVEKRYGDQVYVRYLDTTMNPETKKRYVGNALPLTILFSEGDEAWRRLGASVEPEKVAVFLDDLL